ncbi:MAG: NAD(P)H-dependent glycerol-3-phosphate dehydrogenase [Pseudomonadota bacterium]
MTYLLPVPQSPQITIIGAGSWGTAIAILLAKNGVTTQLWGRDEKKIQRMIDERCNAFFLPQISFPEKLQANTNFSQVILSADIILIAVPSHAFRETLKKIKQVKPNLNNVCWATKGLEVGSQKLLHEVVIEEFGSKLSYAVISGPTFASEVAKGLPTAVTIASNQNNYATLLADLFHNKTFRPYISSDVIGLEIGGAVKNILAIAAGIADGLGYGANTRAALITRGIAEMTRLALKLGAKKETLMGMSGLGDLLLTCTDDQSRNRRMGLAIGSGKTLQQAQEEIVQVVEGIQTAKEIYNLSKKHQVNMPIVEQVYHVLYENISAKQAVINLLERDYTHEHLS